MRRSLSARELEKLDKRYAWHPFTQMKDWQKEEAVVIERGKGNYLIDSRGRRYLDGVSSLWCNVHGHRVPPIDRAIKNQLARIAHTTFLGLSHPQAIELSRRLVSVAPRGLSRVFYSDSGAAAVEVALKIAFQYWQLKGQKKKKLFLKLRNAYHGDTLGSVSVGGIDLFHQIFGPLLFETVAVDAPYRYRDRFEGSEDGYAVFCAKKVEKVLQKRHSEIAALIVEPLMQGAAGMLSQPRGYLSRLRRLASDYGTLFIADEVATGFGRTGRLFACDHEGVKPDILCVAKGITAGYLPLSATLVRKEIYRVFLGEFDEFKAFYHGHTYTANPLACAAANANLSLFSRPGFWPTLRKKIVLFSNELEKFKGLPFVGDVRQIGLMAGIELVADTRKKTEFAASKRIGHRVILEARKKGVMLRPLGNVIVLMPPLSITAAEIGRLGRVVREAISNVLEKKVAI